MEKYYFTKWIDGEVLQEAIVLRTSLSELFCGIRILGTPENIPDDNIEICTTRALYSHEQDEITNIINVIDENYDLWVRKKIEKQTMSWAIKEGQEVIAQIGANNIYRGKDENQTDRLVENYPNLLNALGTGSLKKAYREFLAITPNDDFTQEELDEFVKRMEYLLRIKV